MGCQEFFSRTHTPVSEWNQKNQRSTTHERNLRRRRKERLEYPAEGFPGTRTHKKGSSGVRGTNTGSAEEVPPELGPQVKEPSKQVPLDQEPSKQII